MPSVRDPFNPNVIQTLGRQGTALSRLVALSDEELKIIRSCVQAGADIFYPEISDSIAWWMDGMVQGEGWVQGVQRLFPTQRTGYSGGDLIPVAVTNADGNVIWRQNPIAINDAVYWLMPLTKGTYQIDFLYAKSSAGGKVKLYLDSQLVDDFDTYAAATTPNTLRQPAGCVVAASGLIDFQATVYGKNASSSSYAFAMQYFDFRRTGY